MKYKTLTVMALLVLFSMLSFTYAQVRTPYEVMTDEVVTTATLAGRILDSEGNPISGVLVNCQGPGGTTSYVTGSDGAYRFNLSRNGHYTILPTLAGSYVGQADFDVIVPGADFVRP